MKNVILHNPRCRKSREAIALLEEQGIDFEIRKYLDDPLSEAELQALSRKLTVPIEQAIRKGETDFKENFKGKKLSSDQWIAALVQYPKLLERPIFITPEAAVIGRPKEALLPYL